jgi:hypothetical protein
MKPTYRQIAESEKHLIPYEFWAMLEYQAYERGHSDGQYEVDLILMNLVNDFVEASIKYAARTGKTLV